MKTVLTIIFIVAFLVVACNNAIVTPKASFSKYFYNILGTVINVKFYSASDKFSDKKFKIIKSEMKKLEKIFSDSDSKSLLSLLNKKRKLKINSPSSKMLYDVIKISLEIMKESNGNFNPMLGSLIKKWGFFTKFRVPTDEEIKNEVYKIKSSKISLKDDEIFLIGDATLDLGGIAKGYIVDKIVEKYKNDKSVTGGIIDAGGDIVLFGKKGIEDGFSVGIRKPVKGGGILKIIHVKDPRLFAIATSGDYERFFIVDGIRYHHLLNPFDGLPKKTDIKSVTVLSNRLILSDALATAVFIGGEKIINKLLKKFHFEYLIVKKSGEIKCSPKVKLMIE